MSSEEHRVEPHSGTAAQGPIDPTDGTAAPSRRRGRARLLLIVAALVLAFDIAAKLLAVEHLRPEDSSRLFHGLIYLSLVRNGGAAFGLATGMTAILAAAAIVVAVVIIRLAPRLQSMPWTIGFGLVLGGALGNLVDRIFRSPGLFRGEVVDFVSVFGPDGERFPVFNVADAALTIGAITLAIAAFLGIGIAGRSEVDNTSNPADQTDGPERHSRTDEPTA